MVVGNKDPEPVEVGCGLYRKLPGGSGKFRVQMGARAPFHDENSAPIREKSAPYPDPDALFFKCLNRIWGNT